MSSSKRSISELLDPTDPSIGPSTKRCLNDDILSLPPIKPSRSPPFQKPYQLLSFSYTSGPSPKDPGQRLRTLEWNNSSMKFFVHPPPSANLAYGYERWYKRPEERGRLDGLLEACLRTECEAERARAGIVTWRGVITKILTFPYEDRDGWECNVMYADETLYLEEHLSDERLSDKSNLTGKQRLMTYYGYAFESYCTSDTPPDSRGVRRMSESHGWGGDVDTNVQWCSVVKTKLGSTRMILGGEVDCVRDRNTGQPDTFVELKTSLAIRPGNRSDEVKFEKKLLKFYFQSFLLGVPEIVVGFRTPTGYIQTVQSFKTMDIPRSVRGKPGAWDPSVCLLWGTRVFEFLHNHITRHNDGGHGVWRVKFTPRVGLSIYKLDDDGVEDVAGGENRVGFLPQWYWDRIQYSSKAHDGGLKTVDLKKGEVPATAANVDSLPIATIRKPEEPTNSLSVPVTTQKVQGWQI